MSEQEAIIRFLKQEYGGKKLPHLANQVVVGDYGPYATLDTGTWDGQITVVGVRFDDGEYEVRDYENRISHYKTLEEMKQGLAQFLESVMQGELERVVTNRTRRR